MTKPPPLISCLWMTSKTAVQLWSLIDAKKTCPLKQLPLESIPGALLYSRKVLDPIQTFCFRKINNREVWIKQTTAVHVRKPTRGSANHISRHCSLHTTWEDGLDQAFNETRGEMWMAYFREVWLVIENAQQANWSLANQVQAGLIVPERYLGPANLLLLIFLLDITPEKCFRMGKKWCSWVQILHVFCTTKQKSNLSQRQNMHQTSQLLGKELIIAQANVTHQLFANTAVYVLGIVISLLKEFREANVRAHWHS